MDFQSPDNSAFDSDCQALIQKLDEKGIAALWGMILLSKLQGEFTLNELKHKTDLSSTEAKNRVKPWEENSLLEVNLRPNTQYPNMQAAHLYRFADWVDVDELQLILTSRIVPRRQKDRNKVEEREQLINAHEDLQLRELQSNKAPKTLEELRKIFSAISLPYRSTHIQILKWMTESDDITANSISKKTGQRPSTGNAQLERVRGFGLSYREKRFGEYHYFLIPDLDKDLVTSLFQEDVSQDAPVISVDPATPAQDLQLRDNEPKAIQLVADMPLPKNSPEPQHSQDEVKRLTPIEQLMEIMEKFPAFNPSWSEQLQERWFNSFERMTQFIVGETESNKTKR